MVGLASLLYRSHGVAALSVIQLRHGPVSAFRSISDTWGVSFMDIGGDYPPCGYL
jgi:hypothetical protein